MISCPQTDETAPREALPGPGKARGGELSAPQGSLKGVETSATVLGWTVADAEF